jgi:glycerophosphoryl diester phosphodiesterase
VPHSDPFSFAGPVEIVAHRGYSARAPENTRVALELGLDAGADGVEFDLHATRDGIPVLFHDRTLNRTTDGTGPIDAWNADQLRRLDAGGWFASDFKGEPIPTLEEIACGVGQRAGRLYAEIKGYRRPEDLHEIVRVIAEADLAERTVFISMDWDALDRVRSVDSTALIGYIVDQASRAHAAIERTSGDPRALLDFGVDVLLAHPEQAEAASDAGIPLGAWTVNTVGQAEQLRTLGVARFTTNEVADLVAWKTTL